MTTPRHHMHTLLDRLYGFDAEDDDGVRGDLILEVQDITDANAELRDEARCAGVAGIKS